METHRFKEQNAENKTTVAIRDGAYETRAILTKTFLHFLQLLQLLQLLHLENSFFQVLASKLLPGYQSRSKKI